MTVSDNLNYVINLSTQQSSMTLATQKKTYCTGFLFSLIYYTAIHMVAMVTNMTTNWLTYFCKVLVDVGHICQQLILVSSYDWARLSATWNVFSISDIASISNFKLTIQASLVYLLTMLSSNDIHMNR